MADRMVWVGLSKIWPGWRTALVIVQPETVLRWHREGFRAYWRWKSRPRGGRPRCCQLKLPGSSAATRRGVGPNDQPQDLVVAGDTPSSS